MKDRVVPAVTAGVPAMGIVEGEPSHLRLQALSSMGQAIGACGNLEELYRTVYTESGRMLDTTGFILGLYEETSQTVTVVYQVDSGKELPGGSFPLGSGFTSQVIRTGQPRLIRRWSEEGPRVQIQYATQKQGLPESSATVPLVIGDRVIGFISAQSYRPNAYDATDLLCLQIIASQAAAAVDSLQQSASPEDRGSRRLSELETILSSMREALLIVDRAGCITRLNGAARELLCGGGDGVILGQPLDHEQWGQWSLGPRELAVALTPYIEAIRRGEELSDLEVEVRGDGRRTFSFSSAPLHDSSGAVTGGVIIFRDVTGRREVERIKDEVLSIASHELKSPLTVIKAQAQYLQMHREKDKLTPETLDSSLNAILRQSERLIRLLNLLMDLSRIESGRLEIQPNSLDLVDLARHAIEGVQATTAVHRLRLLGPEELYGDWDAQRLEQLFQNLLGNAVKYSPSGGAVEVMIDPGEDEVTVCVRDEGMGIDPEELDHLFERFYRAEGTRRLEGSGLGLYICEGIVSAHGGRIWVESDGPGCGSSFYFTLPRALPDLAD